jgi:hypothetical protein
MPGTGIYYFEVKIEKGHENRYEKPSPRKDLQLTTFTEL